MASNRIDLSFRNAELTEIHVDGSDDRVILLDTADMGVLTRFRAAIPQMDEIDDTFRRLAAERAESEIDDPERLAAMADTLHDAEVRLAAIIDGIFNADVCGPASGGVSLYTPADGYLLYELIIYKLAGLYGDEMQRQAEMRRNRIAKHTNKYAK